MPKSNGAIHRRTHAVDNRSKKSVVFLGWEAHKERKKNIEVHESSTESAFSANECTECGRADLITLGVCDECACGGIVYEIN